jgi:hypothetical protein
MSFALIHGVIRMSAVVLVMMCGGCGASVSDETADSQARPAADIRQSDKTQIADVLPAVGTIAQENGADGEAKKTAASNQLAGREVLSEFSVPRPILTDLASPEAGIRLRALDHWDTKDTKAPLDPVFEALEDEDPAVRAKATAIVEQYWAAEQEPKKG